MHYIGFQIDSIKIDSLNKRWIARALFLLIFLIYTIFNFCPPGDPDFSKLFLWMTKYTEMNPEAPVIYTFPEISSGNVVFLAFSIGLFILFLILSFLYTGLYLADQSSFLLKETFWRLIKRIPSLLFFLFLLFLPLLIILSIPYLNIILLLLVIPPVYMAPAMIIEEKTPSFEAIFESYKSTRGFRFSIFLNFIVLFSIYNIADFLFSIIIKTDTNGHILVSGFLTAFLVMASGRNMGIIYRIIKSSPIINEK